MDAPDLSTLPETLIVGGYGVKAVTRDGHLVITASNGQLYRVPRQPRTVRRVLILSDTGYITLEAQRWMTDAEIRWTHLDSDGRIIAISANATTDARLIRAQSRAHADGDLAAVGQEITRYLLSVKLHGQADNLDKFFSSPGAGTVVREYANGETIAEGKAADTYWQSWSVKIAVPFSPQDMLRVPARWLGFSQRPSLNGRQPLNADATDPVNAILNYLYKVAETECIHACHAYGLHPALGINHTDKSGRDSMALDLLETIRPVCERIALEILAPDGMIPYVNGKPAYLDRLWFHETREGTCRIVPPLTHKLASHAVELYAAAEPHAYRVAQMLAHAATGVVSVKHPLKPARTTGIHKGTNLARLHPGTTATAILPDTIWQQIQPIIPARQAVSSHGRNIKPPTRELLASIVIRYTLRCGWSDCPVTDKRIVNVWHDHLAASGTWAKIESILADAGHLPALTA